MHLNITIKYTLLHSSYSYHNKQQELTLPQATIYIDILIHTYAYLT